MDKDEDGPERTCIVMRRKASPEAMIRFVVGPEAQVVPDLRRKLPGRGVWVTAEEAVVAEAIKKKAFARGFKAQVKAEPTMAATIGDLMARDALQSLAMANKAGAVITGFNRVEGTLAGGGVAALVHASDGSEDGIRKLEAAARRHAAGRPGGATPVITIKLFASHELDLALGRTNVIHAALVEGPAGEAFLTRCRRLMTYRSTAGPDLSADAEAATA